MHQTTASGCAACTSQLALTFKHGLLFYSPGMAWMLCRATLCCDALCCACPGVWGIRVTGPKAASSQPFVGIVDCGASFSAVNFAAARLLGLLDSSGNLSGPRGPDVISLGE